jgi:hypothetical protein
MPHICPVSVAAMVTNTSNAKKTKMLTFKLELVLVATTGQCRVSAFYKVNLSTALQE